jgi:hypothetical protein
MKMDIETLRRETYLKHNFKPLESYQVSPPGCLTRLLFPNLARIRLDAMKTMEVNINKHKATCESVMWRQVLSEPYKYDEGAIEWAIGSAIDALDMNILYEFMQTCKKYPKEVSIELKERVEVFVCNKHKEDRIMNTRTHWNRLLGYAIDDSEFEELYHQENITTQNGLKYFKTLSEENKKIYNQVFLPCF